MKSPEFRFRVKVDVFRGKADWYHALLPRDGSLVLDEMFSSQKRGWASLPVSVFLGDTTWETSIFFDRKKERYMLPLKKEIRKKEGLDVGDEIDIVVEVIV